MHDCSHEGFCFFVLYDYLKDLKESATHEVFDAFHHRTDALDCSLFHKLRRLPHQRLVDEVKQRVTELESLGFVRLHYISESNDCGHVDKIAFEGRVRQLFL